MGRGTSGATLAPTHDRAADEPADSDQRLVAAVRRGDDRAFELLYERYQRRIHAYVVGMVKDHGRAEDVTQEVFVSALRRMRETEQPLAFKPWLYQIAKNSCIDAFRRSKRTEEVSYDADGGLAPADHSKLVGPGPSPDAAVAAKQEIESLCGAFGGLSETHHEILVLRELEGLSYQQIGQRMGMSRPAVESTLFRARRRLTEEYDDIVSGARCLRIEGIITTAAQTSLGARDTRRLARHLAHCQSCRREALVAGLDRSLITRPSLRERVARVAGFLPLPGLLRFRRSGGEAMMPPTGRGAGWSAQLPMFSDHLSSGWGKAAAGAAVLVAGVGAGAGVRHVAMPSSSSEKPAPALVQPATSAMRPVTIRDAAAAPKAVRSTDSGATARRPTSTKRIAKRRSSEPQGSGSPTAAAGPAASGDGGPVQPSSSASGSNPQPAGEQETAKSSKPAPPRKTTPAVDLPATTPDPVKETAATVETTVNSTTEAAKDATSEATQQLDETVQKVVPEGPVPDAVHDAGAAVNETVGKLGDGVNEATQDVTDTVGGITGG